MRLEKELGRKHDKYVRQGTWRGAKVLDFILGYKMRKH